MDIEILSAIEKRLHETYVHYRFQVQIIQNKTVFMISIYKGQSLIQTYNAPNTMPSNVFWDNIRTLMIEIMQKYGY
jgi:hypothetical protein